MPLLHENGNMISGAVNWEELPLRWGKHKNELNVRHLGVTFVIFELISHV